MENCLPRDSSDTVEPRPPAACLQITTAVTLEKVKYHVGHRVEASHDGFFFKLLCSSIPIVLAKPFFSRVPPRLDWLALV